MIAKLPSHNITLILDCRYNVSGCLLGNICRILFATMDTFYFRNDLSRGDATKIGRDLEWSISVPMIQNSRLKDVGFLQLQSYNYPQPTFDNISIFDSLLRGCIRRPYDKQDYAKAILEQRDNNWNLSPHQIFKQGAQALRNNRERWNAMLGMFTYVTWMLQGERKWDSENQVWTAPSKPTIFRICPKDVIGLILRNVSPQDFKSPPKNTTWMKNVIHAYETTRDQKDVTKLRHCQDESIGLSREEVALKERLHDNKLKQKKTTKKLKLAGIEAADPIQQMNIVFAEELEYRNGKRRPRRSHEVIEAEKEAKKQKATKKAEKEAKKAKK